MKKVLTVLVLLLVAGILFAGGGRDQQGAGRPIELIYTTCGVPSDGWAQAMVKFKEVVERVSNGQIKVLTYDSSTLFKQEQEVAAVISGQADLTLTGAQWLTDGSPWVSMFAAGYMYHSYEHMTKVMNGPIGQEVFERIAKEQGIRPLGATYMGTRQINLVEDRPIRTPADLRGVNLRMPNSEAWIFLGRALGANPTPISLSELYMALQTRTVDGTENPLPQNKSGKFYEVTKSVSITNHLVGDIWPSINEKRWQSMTAQQKDWIMQGIRAGNQLSDDISLKEEADIINFYKQQGLKVYEADIKAFSSYVLDQYLKSDFAKTWDMDVYRKVQAAAN